MTKKLGRSGYKNPPDHTRFKPGVSGNPRGRRKRSDDDFDSLLHEELAKPIAVNDRGVVRLVPAYKLIALSIIKNAAKGDRNSIRIVEERTKLHIIPRREKERRRKEQEAKLQRFIDICDDLVVCEDK